MHASFLCLACKQCLYIYILTKTLTLFKVEHTMSLLSVQEVLASFTQSFALNAYDANFLACQEWLQ